MEFIFYFSRLESMLGEYFLHVDKERMHEGEKNLGAKRNVRNGIVVGDSY